MSAALALSHLSVELGGRVVVDDVSLSFARGSVTAVVGRSGAGKSVLMKAAAGLLLRSGGDVVLSVPPLVFVHQDPALLDDLDVIHNVALPARAKAQRNGTPAPDPRVWLAKLGVDDVADQLPRHLSPSQARRTALARALLLTPGVLIVDEPTTGLDPHAGDDVDDALCSVVDPQRALIVITHHPRTLARLLALENSSVVVVEAGRVSHRTLQEARP
ncbi:MAG: ATP-binding cassette domain-containing protein [Deltaproteobacteria bacterium]|nr:ATP-binding cassette domain-containing protein [Deltaproteobacteria bacterium]